MKTILLLTISNIFMTLAWYGHLKFPNKPLWLAIKRSDGRWEMDKPEIGFEGGKNGLAFFALPNRQN